ncbi:spore germination protein [Anaerotaenia torta]|uniref:LysM peptidoglycan-binding domain-containing protein n=1 Tax=Anaerotaenia torta TaxID=433293 RepID=UPI003D243FF1
MVRKKAWGHTVFPQYIIGSSCVREDDMTAFSCAVARYGAVMIIHVVKPGETIYTIAADYNVSVTRLVEDNGLINPEHLVIGQTVVIAYPAQVYIAQEGDTVEGIAEIFQITVMQLLRNNPFLFNRTAIYQGEIIVIRYDTEGRVSINAYAYPFINRNTLRKTLPFLTYLTIFNYRTVQAGEIEGVDDTEIIDMAKRFGVAPLMSLSTLTYQGTGNIEVVNSILYDENNLERHIDTILGILREKGYYGLNISLSNLTQINREAYENFISKLSQRLRAEGYKLFITVTPRIIVNSNEILFEQVDYTVLGRASDYMQILTYGWGSLAGPPTAITSAHLTELLLQEAITMVPPQKIYAGISVIGYNWQEPYVLGMTRANSLSNDAAIELAVQTESVIKFEESAQAPYFEYTAQEGGEAVRHIVWFSDARSINSLVSFVPEYGIQGVGIWNIMSYFTQMWLVINSQYRIDKVLPEI